MGSVPIIEAVVVLTRLMGCAPIIKVVGEVVRFTGGVRVNEFVPEALAGYKRFAR